MRQVSSSSSSLSAAWIAATLLLTSLLGTAMASSVTPSKTCYRTSESLVMSFVNDFPRSGDRLSVVPASNLNNFLITVTTGTQRTGTVTMTQRLATGSYRTRLLRTTCSFFFFCSTTEIAITNGSYSVSSTCGPVTNPPSRKPTTPPTKSPTNVPTVAITSMPTTSGSHIHGKEKEVYDLLHREIADMILINPRILPLCLRMGFHDCVGGCDGCVDMTDPENKGLEVIIDILAPVVAKYEGLNGTSISRADIWASCAIIAADTAPHGDALPITFENNWFGRRNCEVANTVCRDRNGNPVTCGPKAGPFRLMPSLNFNTRQTFDFFRTNFNFNERQTILSLSAHTVGKLQTINSGIDGEDGWNFQPTVLHNEYIQALLGGADGTSSDADKLNFAPQWVRFFKSNAGTGLPDRNWWRLSLNGKNLNMLNVDICLARDLNANNTNPNTGAVSCTFQPATGSPTCPIGRTFRHLTDMLDNNLYLREFKRVLELMLANGYFMNNCGERPCPLIPR